MTTDRELLEMAAKAARYQYAKHGGYIVVDGIPGNWNPLTDDGDALRLAVKLKLKVYQGDLVAIVHPRMSHAYIAEEYERNGDHYAATRRAIVRAAAEIGKGMQ